MNFATYERSAFQDYADFAQSVLNILLAGIRANPALQAPQAMSRAKNPSSLKKKLSNRGLSNTEELEIHIKDLAGCRLIFYTNADVMRLRQSRLIRHNFNVVETKVHYPDGTESKELYIAQHYLVQLKPERIALPEYTRFAGMRCEVQVQTILNHAWAEMSHDRIYKRPPLGGFGASAFTDIERRMQDVMRKYLLPAGHEFDNIVRNYERLLAGKKLFDDGALDAIVTSVDNNLRADALDNLAEHVLPHYDDIRTQYPNITAKLIEAVERARNAPVVPVETPFGSLPGKTAADITKAVTEIINTYRYIDINQSVDLLFHLYPGATTDDERKSLNDLAINVAKHEISVWRAVGPALHRDMLDRIKLLPAETFESLRPMLICMLNEILRPERTGTSNTSNTITLSRGAVPASEDLRTIRHEAIDLIKSAMLRSNNDDDRLAAIRALAAATHTPSVGLYSDELFRIIMDNASDITAFHSKIAPSLSYELRQKIEHDVLGFYRRYSTLPNELATNNSLAEARDRLIAATDIFRAAISTDEHYKIYKILVGFESVFPVSWQAGYVDSKVEQSYRQAQINILFDQITEHNADEWFDILSRCAQTQSNDLATFPCFGALLRRLGKEKPQILIGYIGRMNHALARFLPAMLDGLMEGPGREQILSCLGQWIDEGKYLGEITWYLRSGASFDENLLQRSLAKAIDVSDDNAIRNALIAAVAQYDSNPGTLINAVFMPALINLSAKGDRTLDKPALWFSWRDSGLLQALEQEQALAVLTALVPYPRINYDLEELLTALALRWPDQVLGFFSSRRQFARTSEATDGYDAIPYKFHALEKQLETVPDSVLAIARAWFEGKDSVADHYDGGRLVANIFPVIDNEIEKRLVNLARSDNHDDVRFVLSVMRNYEGQEFLHGICKEIVSKFDLDDDLVKEVEVVLGMTGLMEGEFGIVEAHTRKKSQMDAWLKDPRTNVQAFARQYIHDVEQTIRAEQQEAERSIAMRKLEYGEDLMDG